MRTVIVGIIEAYNFFSITYKILSRFLMSRLTPYAEEIIGDHQCGFRCSSSATDQIICACKILEKNGNAVTPWNS
jgi:hypothetical protein